MLYQTASEAFILPHKMLFFTTLCWLEPSRNLVLLLSNGLATLCGSWYLSTYHCAVGEECYENNWMEKNSSNAEPQTNAFISSSVQMDHLYQLAHT